MELEDHQKRMEEETHWTGFRTGLKLGLVLTLIGIFLAWHLR